MSTRSPASRTRPQLWWQLRVDLLDVSPLIWRRLLVPDSIVLPTLHQVLQVTLGWTDSHLHEFVINGIRYAAPDPDWSEDLQQRDERRVVLNKALGQSRCFDYVYDFGDDWHHVITVEDVRVGSPSEPLSLRCLAGENACPPEDVGGSHGYVDFLAALADPTHEQHEEYRAWNGGSFEPTRFDLLAINQQLSKTKA